MDTTFNTKKIKLALFWGQIKMSFGQVLFLLNLYFTLLSKWASSDKMLIEMLLGSTLQDVFCNKEAEGKFTVFFMKKASNSNHIILEINLHVYIPVHVHVHVAVKTY